MRIGLFSDTYLPDINGVVSSTVTLQKALEKNGHEVFVIANHKGLLHTEREGNVLRLPGVELKWLYGYIMSSPIQLSAKEEIRQMNLDVIHVQTEFGVGIFARIVAKELGIPIVYTYHTMYEDYTHYVNLFDIDEVDKVAKKVTGSISRIISDGCDAVIAPSIKTKETLLKYGVKSPIHVIPTGLDLKKFNPANIDAEAVQALRQEYGLGADDKLMIYVGRIASEKSIDVAIRGFVDCAKANKHYKLMIVGGGPDLDELKELAKQCGIEDSVIFAGKKPSEEVPLYYAMADAFVSCSLTETQGMTFIEAMAAGLPIFVRRDEVVEDLVEEGVSGFYIEEDTFSLKAMAYFECDEKVKQKMSQKAMEKVQKYDSDIFYASIMDVYEEAIATYHKTYLIKKVRIKDDCAELTLVDNQKDEFTVLVSVEDYFAFELKKDGIVHEATLDELQKREVVLKQYIRCIKRIALKARTRREMYDFLIKEDVLDIKQINEMIERLEDEGYINDDAYLADQVDKLLLSTDSKKRIIHQLTSKGLPYEKVAKAFENVDDEKEKEKAERYAHKNFDHIKGKSVYMKKQTLLRQLTNKGFSFDIAKSVVESLNYDEDKKMEKENLDRAIEKEIRRYSKKYEGKKLKNAILKSLIRKGYNSDDVLLMIEEKGIDNE